MKQNQCSVDISWLLELINHVSLLQSHHVSDVLKKVDISETEDFLTLYLFLNAFS